MATSTPLPPGANHFISLAKAKEMTALFRAEKENILAPEFKGKDILCICETFNREAFDALLAENGCVGLRIYFGMTDELKVRVIAVGVNANNEDILPSQGNAPETGDEDQNFIVELGLPCPPWCPPPPPPPSLSE